MTAGRMSRRVLRIRPWLAVVVVAANALFLGGAASTYAESGWTLTSIGFGVLSAVGVIGILELLLSRIVLQEDSLETYGLLSRRRYSASQIRSVKWEGGSGVALELSQGGWAKLPELGYNSQSLANTLRAWLKSCQRGEE
jgi:hypothetical protein